MYADSCERKQGINGNKENSVSRLISIDDFVNDE